jgi:alpha-ketoglutarate-dependent taurine dioxygenase
VHVFGARFLGFTQASGNAVCRDSLAHKSGALDEWHASAQTFNGEMVALSFDVAPSPAASSTLRFEPLASSSSEIDFAVDAKVLDLPRLSSEEFAELERAVYTHHVVVVRGQRGLTPHDQFELTRRFDPTVVAYGHGNRPEIMQASVLVQDLVSIPACPQVKLLGHGRVLDHEGIADVTLSHPSHRSFHRTPLTSEQEARGLTRFYRWHMDAALYELHPPRVTTLLALDVPEGPDQTVVYDDGSGDELSVSLGTTAFVSGNRAFAGLTAAQQEFALRTRVRYAPHPYVWMRRARARSNGLGLFSEGLELEREELPPHTEDKITTLPLVWQNPVTGRPSLQVHAYCVEDLIVDGEAVGDLAECRRLLYELMRPAIAPARVYAHRWQPGDLVIFNNRGVWHSVVGALGPDDRRVYHQCNLASSEPPRGMEDRCETS